MTVQLFTSPREHFSELVEAGLVKLKIQAFPGVQSYLVDLLEHYLDTRNLYPAPMTEAGQRVPQTMAEMWLTAAHLSSTERFDLLKQMGDRALYISGFFSDSLQRKTVDVDYYAEMGGAAYASLAQDVREDTKAQVFRTFAKRFNQFADVLSYISHQSSGRSDESLLRLYERFLRTGSEVAREQLLEMGVVMLPTEQIKKARQD